MIYVSMILPKRVIQMSTYYGEKLERFLSEPNTNKDLAVWHHFEIIVSKDLNEENTFKTTSESIAL